MKLTSGQKICKSRLNTAFTGFVIDIRSLKAMYSNIVVEQQLMSSFPTYHILQDSVELFFLKIRSANGYNDNPTVQQFSAAFRKLLAHSKVHVSEKGNCSEQGVMSNSVSNILTVSSHRVKSSVDENFDFESIVPTKDELEKIHTTIFEVESKEESDQIEALSDFTIAHAASIIEKRIKQIDRKYCEICANMFDQNEKVHPSFTGKSNTIPCSSTFTICKTADKFLKFELLSGDFVFDAIIYVIYDSLDFSSLYSATDFSHDINHKIYMVKIIIDMYVHIKATFLAKSATFNAHPNGNKRKKLHKLIHYRNE